MEVVELRSGFGLNELLGLGSRSGPPNADDSLLLFKQRATYARKHDCHDRVSKSHVPLHRMRRSPVSP